MWMRSIGLGAMAVLALAVASGCNQSSSNDSTPSAGPQPQASGAPGFESVARLHWLGKKRLAADTNATHFLSICNLPETGRLENQTLDKLATALASSLSPTNTQAATANPRLPLGPRLLSAPPTPETQLSRAATQLRPLLADLIQEESFLEIGAVTNQPGEVLLAVRLSPERAHFWETNFSTAMDSVTGSQVAGTNLGRVWTLARKNIQLSAPAGSGAGKSMSAPVASVRLDRAGEWTVVSLSSGTNAFLVHALARIQRDGAPFAAPVTNYWVETTFDLSGIARLLALGWQLPANWPVVQMNINGEGENVRTRGELEFSHPLNLELTPWNIPTNLIHDPLIGFCAVRGIGPWLKSLPVWSELKLTTSPDQVYIWAQAGMPVLEYFAAQWKGADGAFKQLSKTLPELVNPWLKSKVMGGLTNSPVNNGLAWEGAPFVSPQLYSVVAENGEYVFAGLIPLVRTNQPPPEDLLREVVSDPNRMAYDWEVTSPRIEQILYVTQLARVIVKEAQLPPASASLEWLKAAAPKLGNCVTVASPNGADRISFTRKSSCGLDAMELQLLADWFESPSFPLGLHSLVAPTPSNPLPRAGTAH